jgi:uncharacterized protein YdhG (YjbR/CyaY superfamily)
MDEYIADFPPKIRTLLKQIRKTIRETAPDAEETISYGMPAFRQGRILVYFAAFKNHIGFFPTASGVSAFKKELKRFECTKGTIRLPFDQPLPLPLIRRIVKFRVREIRPE